MRWQKKENDGHHGLKKERGGTLFIFLHLGYPEERKEKRGTSYWGGGGAVVLSEGEKFFFFHKIPSSLQGKEPPDRTEKGDDHCSQDTIV